MTDEKAGILPRPPKFLRTLAEWAGVITALGAFAGWIVSVASFVGRMTFWKEAWAFVLSRNWPAMLADALRATGAAIHQVLGEYRRILDPLTDWLSGWLPFALPDWTPDAMFVVGFSLIGLVRVGFVGKQTADHWINYHVYPRTVLLHAGILAPVLALQLWPAHFLVRVADMFGGNWTGFWGGLRYFAWVLTFIVAALLGYAFVPICILLVEGVYLGLRSTGG